MQITYFLSTIIILISWFIHYILIIITILTIIGLFIYIKTKTDKPTLQKLPKRYSKGSTPTSKTINQYSIKHFYYISKNQNETIQKIIDTLEKSETLEKYNIANRLQAFCLTYWQKKSLAYELDLYDYIFNASKERIKTAQRDFVKRECETVMQIIQLLKDGISVDCIIQKISLLDKKEIDKITIDKENTTTPDTNTYELETNTHKLVISQIISGLLNYAIRRENTTSSDIDTYEQNNDTRRLVISQIISGLLNYVIYRENTTTSDTDTYELETNKRRQIISQIISNLLTYAIYRENETSDTDTYELETNKRGLVISQIISGLLNYAICRENITTSDTDTYELKTDTRKLVISPIISDLQSNTICQNSIEEKSPNKQNVRFNLSTTDSISKDIPTHINLPNKSTIIPHNPTISNKEVSLTKEVPYWEHTYVYSADYLQNASQQQKQFYNYFKEEFLRGNYIDIEGNYNYAFILMFDLADDYKKHKNYDLLNFQLTALAENYSVTSKYTNKTLLSSIIEKSREELMDTLKSYDKANGQLCHWITSKEIVEVQGIKLTRGNFYIGECFLLPENIIEKNRIYNYGKEITHIYGPVLNPKLSIDDNKEEKSVFSSYQNMSPAVRYEYLMWLSGKRKISEVSIEVLLFYLYGCEIRMFIDPETNLFERKIIIDDILQIYNFCSKREFCCDQLLLDKLRDFIAYSIIKFFRTKIGSFDIKSILNNNYTYRECFITPLITNKNVLTPEDIFDITCKVYDIEKYVPSMYIPAAKQLYLNRFSKHNNININKSTEDITKYIDYSNNNCNFYSEKMDLTYKIESISKDFYNIDFAVNSCYWNIKSEFSQYNIEKEYSKGKETIVSFLLLPEEVELKSIPSIQDVITRIKSEMYPNQYLIKPIDWLLELFEFRRQYSKSIYQYNVDLIINGLSRMGLGIVPNYKIDSKRFNFGDICVIYINEENYPIERTLTYEITELFIKLASYILHMDQILTDDLEFLEKQVLSFGNTKGNQLHLNAYIRWHLQLKKQPINKKIKDTIPLLIYGERILIANTLIKLACINGNVHPKRINGLKKILPLLGMEMNNIHSQIHRILTDEEGFVTIEKKSDAVEFVIDTEIEKDNNQIDTNIILNLEKLHIFEQQTRNAQELLSEIFVDEDIPVSQNIMDNPATDKWKDMLTLLLSKEKWEREEIENRCKKMGLMLGAVLEQINDYAYDKVDDGVVEDDGEYLYVTLDYKEKLI